MGGRKAVEDQNGFCVDSRVKKILVKRFGDFYLMWILPAVE